MEKRLLTPGPTPVPKEIREEMAKPIIHHRTPEYLAIFKEVNDSLKEVLRTKADLAIFTSSGTGAMEASVVNILSPNDKAIVVVAGKFGERFGEICKAYGVKTFSIGVEWGSPLDPQRIKKVLDSEPDVKAVFATLCETSTATVYDIKAIGDILKNHQAVLVVDVISGLCADDFQQDAWSVDIAVGGSQKGLMIPPGLSFCSISKKAWALVEKSKSPKYYFDFKKYKKALEDNDTPFTSAITLMIGLKMALGKIKQKGLDNVIRESAKMAESLRNSLSSAGLKIYSKAPSNAVTAICVPEGIDGETLVKGIKKRDIIVAGGQSQLKGKIFRVAHMGGITKDDVDATIKAVKEVLAEMGYKS